MSVTAVSGPTISFGVTLSSTSGDGITGADMEHNGSRAPVLADLGDAMLDPRSAYDYKPGSAATSACFGFYNNAGNVDFVPITANTSALVVNTASSGTATFTLAAASSGGGTYSTTIIAPETGKATGTLIAFDSTAATVTFGSDGTVKLWNPGAGTGRNITIKPSSNLDGGTYSIAGRDMYGYKVTETIAGGSTNLAGKKAFKYISSITNCSSPTSTGILVGFGDVFGFPLKVPYVSLNSQVALIATTFGTSISVAVLPSSVTTNLASTVATQTSTTPDVRGTYTSSTATNATIRLQMIITPSASAVAAVTVADVSPLFGGVQFSSV